MQGVTPLSPKLDPPQTLHNPPLPSTGFLAPFNNGWAIPILWAVASFPSCTALGQRRKRPAIGDGCAMFLAADFCPKVSAEAFRC